MNTALITMIPISDLAANPLNVRKRFDPKQLEELAGSLKAHGVIQPLTVRPLKKGRGRPSKDAASYELVCGERRFRAAQIAQLDSVPCQIRDLDDDAALEIMVIENNQREDVHPLEEAAGFREVLDRGMYDVAQLGEKIGRTAEYVRRRVKLNDLVDEARERLEDGKMHLATAELLARLSDVDQLRAISSNWNVDSPASLRNWISQNITRDLRRAYFSLEDPELNPKAGPCASCAKRTGVNRTLFGELLEGDQCTDGKCWDVKLAAHVEKKKAEGLKVLTNDWNQTPEGMIGRDRWREVQVSGDDAPDIPTPDDLVDHDSQMLFSDGAEEFDPEHPDAPLTYLDLDPDEEYTADERKIVLRGYEAARDAFKNWQRPEPTYPEGTVLGIVAHGWDIGKVLHVLIGEGRASTGSNQANNSQKEAERKRKIELCWRQFALEAVIERNPPEAFTTDLLRNLARKWYADVWAEFQKKACKLLGIPSGEVHEWFNEATRDQLIAMILCLACSKEVWIPTYGEATKTDFLTTLCEGAGIELDPIRAEAAAKFAPKATRAKKEPAR
jgi:ParB/RepB/Spo0J family partition protein